MGTVAVDPVKENYAKGDTVIVIAEAKEGYEFVNWTSEGKVFSDSAAYEFAVEKDMELTANFKANIQAERNCKRRQDGNSKT